MSADWDSIEESTAQSDIGAPPGTLVIHPDAQRPVIEVMAYGPDHFTEQEIKDPRRVRNFLGKWPVTWVNVSGLGDVITLGALGRIFNLHRLALEDVAHRHERAKVERYGEHLFIVARMVALAERLETEQVSIFVGKDFILTFQEGKPGDSFGPVRTRIRSGIGQIRTMGPDYLAYSLLDAIVDDYFPVVEQYGQRLETMEDETIEKPDNEIIAQIHDTKHDMVTLRRTIWAMREAVKKLVPDPTNTFSQETQVFLRDCYDHTIQVMEMVETYRELCSDLMNLYLSSVSNRMNEIMKVLTVVGTIFIPLTFITGVYGMNFDPRRSPLNMPELWWYWGYPASLAFMGLITVVLLFLFRRMKWF